MNFEEQWIKWEPINDLSGSYNFNNFTDDEENGFELILNEKNNKRKLQVLWSDSINTFRITNKNLRDKKFYKLSKKYGVDFFLNWAFFKIYNSEYLQWLSDESYTFADGSTHYCIILPELIIDIAASYEPIVKFID